MLIRRRMQASISEVKGAPSPDHIARSGEPAQQEARGSACGKWTPVRVDVLNANDISVFKHLLPRYLPLVPCESRQKCKNHKALIGEISKTDGRIERTCVSSTQQL
eukprot:5019335-Pleurochrysis_carterae.AAC.3